MITLLVTGLFGDFVIKRNIQAYTAESAAFAAAPAEADQAFANARATYNERLKDRRRASQQIIKYIKDNNISTFAAAYPDYARTVEAWNENLSLMADTILKTTGCDEVFREADAETRAAAFAPVFAFHTGLAGHAPFLTRFPDTPEKARVEFLGQSRFCPTFFLTLNGPFSVHRQFREIHKNIYNYLEHGHSECRLRHIRNLPDYHRACAAKVSFEPVAACMQRFDRQVASGSFCPDTGFDLEDYKVRDISFNTLDFWWGLGDGFFRSFRESYLLRECRARQGFWGRLMAWDCDMAVRDYLDRRG